MTSWDDRRLVKILRVRFQMRQCSDIHAIYHLPVLPNYSRTSGTIKRDR